MAHPSPPHPLPVFLKPVTKDDIPFLKSVENDSEVGPYIRPWTSAAHERALSDNTLQYFLAHHIRSKRAVGFIILRSNPAAQETIEFVRLAIAQRGRGFGSAAIKAVLDFSKAKNLQSIWLEVFPNNARALAVYRKQGFVETSRSPTERGYGGLPGEVIRMECQLQ